jgi:hypothetical protein
MHLIFRVFETGMAVWFVLLAMTVIGRVLSGEIDAGGLLQHGRDDDSVAPERVVAMIAFPVVLVTYTLSALHADMSVPHPSMPDLSDKLVLLLSGGNGLYLAGKIART